jgi:hypothetical protein
MTAPEKSSLAKQYLHSVFGHSFLEQPCTYETLLHSVWIKRNLVDLFDEIDEIQKLADDAGEIGPGELSLTH